MSNEALDRRDFLRHLASWAMAAAVPRTLHRLVSRLGRRPSILLIATEGLAIDDLGCFGNAGARTPLLNELAAHGLRFSDFHSSSPVRDPTDVATLTGCYPQRLSFQAAMARSHQNPGFVLGAPVITARLQSHGYAVGIATQHLTATGAPRCSIQEESSVDRHPDLFTMTAAPADDTGLTVWNEALSSRADAFIDANQHEPFFLYLPYTASAIEDVPIAERIDRVGRLDTAIGKVIAKMTEVVAPANTFIFFFSSCGVRANRWSQNLRGGHGSLWEGGHRVPAIAYWPGRIRAAARSSDLTSNLDLYPTVLAAAGIATPATEPIDGLNLLDQLGQNQRQSVRTLFWSYSGSRAVRQGAWKYLLNRNGDHKGEYLFKLDQDVREEQNLIMENPGQAESLRQVLRAWESGLAC